jgi:hypothetical protein
VLALGALLLVGKIVWLVPKLLSSALTLTSTELEALLNAIKMEAVGAGGRAGGAVVGFAGAVVGVVCWNDIAVGGVMEASNSALVPVGVLHNPSGAHINPR